MGHVHGLTTLGIEVNASYLGDWPQQIGSFILNFATLELISYKYLDSLESTKDKFNANLNSLLGQRIDRTLKLIENSTSISGDDKEELRALWAEVRQLAIWRNRIAHNPVVPSWKPTSNAEKDPPGLMGIPDMRQLKSSNITDSISLDGMKKLIDASADLGRRLHGAAEKLKK